MRLKWAQTTCIRPWVSLKIYPKKSTSVCSFGLYSILRPNWKYQASIFSLWLFKAVVIFHSNLQAAVVKGALQKSNNSRSPYCCSRTLSARSVLSPRAINRPFAASPVYMYTFSQRERALSHRRSFWLQKTQRTEGEKIESGKWNFHAQRGERENWRRHHREMKLPCI
jgi:hypothetical protein